jgi:hypothetical protein
MTKKSIDDHYLCSLEYYTNKYKLMDKTQKDILILFFILLSIITPFYCIEVIKYLIESYLGYIFQILFFLFSFVMLLFYSFLEREKNILYWEIFELNNKIKFIKGE